MENRYKNYETLLRKKFGAYDWTISDPDDYNTLVWNSDPDLKPTKEFLDKTIQDVKSNYAQHRKNEYPSWEEQMDMIYHQGYDAWKEHIRQIKEEFPKPD